MFKNETNFDELKKKLTLGHYIFLIGCGTILFVVLLSFLLYMIPVYQTHLEYEAAKQAKIKAETDRYVILTIGPHLKKYPEVKDYLLKEDD